MIECKHTNQNTICPYCQAETEPMYRDHNDFMRCINRACGAEVSGCNSRTSEYDWTPGRAARRARANMQTMIDNAEHDSAMRDAWEY